MTADPATPPAGPVPCTPAAIRAALDGNDRSLFEEAYGAALDEARESYSLEGVNLVVDQWWRYINLAGGHSAAVQLAGLIRVDAAVPTIPVDFAALRG